MYIYHEFNIIYVNYACARARACVCVCACTSHIMCTNGKNDLWLLVSK